MAAEESKWHHQWLQAQNGGKQSLYVGKKRAKRAVVDLVCSDGVERNQHEYTRRDIRFGYHRFPQIYLAGLHASGLRRD